MYHAKEAGQEQFQVLTNRKANRKAAEQQRCIESDLRRALEQSEFLLYYQPLVHLDTNEITGVEALIRWQHPTRGLMPPAQFVPVAEDCGLIVKIGHWVLREACKQARLWQVAGLPPIKSSCP